MKGIHHFFLAISFFFAHTLLFAQTTGFEIIYLADTDFAKDSAWVHNIKNDWRATGVNLRIKWADVVDNSFNRNWADVDAALQQLDENSLDIYIRVSLCYTRKAWFSNFVAKDFHRRKIAPGVGDFYYHPYFLNAPYHDNTNMSRRMFNFMSKAPRDSMITFYRQVVQHLDQSPHKDRIKLIVPTISPDDESDYPQVTYDFTDSKEHTEMTGYTIVERDSFKTFLINKYVSIAVLNQTWGPPNLSSFGTASNVIMYNWEKLHDDRGPFDYPKGRKDWIDFKTQALKNFHALLRNETKTHSEPDFPFGLQFGSFYDPRILFRGFYDPTSLIQDIDYLITGDVPEYHPNFNFSADYSRSLSRYWDWRQGKGGANRMKFATETNFPDYRYIPPDTLNKYWERQVEAFYGRGASALFISHWGTKSSEVCCFAQRVQDRDPQLLADNEDWANALSGRFRYQPILKIFHSSATHLSCEQGLYFRLPEDLGYSSDNDYFHTNGHEVGQWVATNDSIVAIYELPFHRFIVPREEYVLNNAQYREWGDIVTNYMLSHSPNYISGHYNELHFTATSYIMPEQAYLNVMRYSLKDIAMTNDTHFMDGTHGEYSFTLGLRNEYHELRSPIHLIWRTRDDLWVAWPEANLNKNTSGCGGCTFDFVEWARRLGCGHDDINDREYPGWSILEGSIFKYDQSIKNVWSLRTDLQAAYPDGHYKVPGSPVPINMLSWVIEYGHAEYPELQNYNHWPYIGGGMAVKINGPTELGSQDAGTWYADTSHTDGAPVTYQWHISTNNGYTWTALGTGPTQNYTMNNKSLS